jgi:hypothetical protein
MSEPSFPFQGTQVAEAPAAELQEARNTKRTVLVLAAVGVLVLGALAYFFLLSGGEDADDSAAPVRKQGTVQPTPEPSATEAPAPVKAPKLSKKAVGKDPFEALVVPAVEGGGGGAVDPVTAPLGGGQVPVTGGNTGGNNGNNGNNGNGNGNGNNGNGNGNGGSTSDTPLTVKVVSVAGDNTSARVTVGTKTYSVAVGDTFATYFKALRLKNGKCGSFTYGDEPFDLCEGDTSRMQ